jgi:hypothetical protein
LPELYLSGYPGPSDVLLYNAVFQRKDEISFFYSILDKAEIKANFMVRGDWLSETGLTNDDIVTWDDVHDMLTLIQSHRIPARIRWVLPVRNRPSGKLWFCIL